MTPPLKDYTIENYINAQKGLSDNQMRILKEKSEQVGFLNYARKNHENLKKITLYTKRAVKEFYPEKHKRGKDKRGMFEPPKKKKSEPKPVKLTDEQKKQQRKEYRKAYNQRATVKEKNRERKRSKKT